MCVGITHFHSIKTIVDMQIIFYYLIELSLIAKAKMKKLKSVHTKQQQNNAEIVLACDMYTICPTIVASE